MRGRGLSDVAADHRFIARNAADGVWNGSAFVPWVDADFAAYAITANARGGKRFAAATPSNTAYYELWKWTGTIGTSYAVFESDGELIFGDGDTTVTEDTGGTDFLRYVIPDGSAGVDSGLVRAYLKSEYDAENFALRDETTTDSNGRFAYKPMYLNSGLTYTLTFTKDGVYQTSKKDVTIP